MFCRSCSKYEQFVLQVLAGEFHRTGVEESSVCAVFRELSARLRTEAMPVLSLPGVEINLKTSNIGVSESYKDNVSLELMFALAGTTAACARLSALRLLLAEHFR